MKKVFMTILVMLVALSLFSSIHADNKVIDYHSENEIEYDKDFEIGFEIPLIKYYPFVYSLDNDFENTQIIGKTNCKEGYLYAKDLETGVVRQLLSVKPDIIRENETGVFCICGKDLVWVDFKGEEVEVLYTSNELKGGLLELNENELFFVDNNSIVSFNIESREIENLQSVETEVDMFVYTDRNNYVYGSNEDRVWFQMTDNEVRELPYDDLENVFARIDQEVDVTSIGGYQYDLPLAEYPNGSYFTYNGAACTSHSNCSYYGGCNCRSFDGCIQCVGFAKYAICKYNHQSAWNPVSSEKDDSNVYLSTNSAVIAYFASLQKGSYVMFSESSSEVDPHVIVYLATTSSGIYLQECNIGGRCLVSIKTRPLADYRNYIDLRWGVYKVTHRYTGSSSYTTSYNSTYHREKCSSNGCTAYILQQHSAYVPGANATCCRCGYVGNITLREPASN